MAEKRPESGSRSAQKALFEHGKRIHFIDWEAVSGAQTTVLLTASIAILSFITGLSHLSQTTIELQGPLAPYVSSYATNFIRIFGVIVAFALIAVAVGLQRRNRYAWYAALVLLPVAAMQALLTGKASDIPLFLLPVITLPMVIANRDHFDRRVSLSTIQIAALSSILAVQIYGTIGVFALRDQYTGIESLTDAFYYIVVTGTTVGYGDATPVTSEAKLFTLSVLVIGTAAFGAGLGSLVVPVIESQMADVLGKMTASELALLEDHVLVLGYGPLTEPLLEQVAPATDVVVITDDPDTASSLRDRDIKVLTGDPTDKAVLREANIGMARGVVAGTENDARDALAILAAAQTNPDARIVAAASDHRNVDKLKGAGAETVISPVVIGGQMLGQAVLGGDDAGSLPDELAGAGGVVDGTDDAS